MLGAIRDSESEVRRGMGEVVIVGSRDKLPRLSSIFVKFIR